MKKVVALFLIVLLFGCQQKEVVPKPDNLIDKEIMVNILYDLSILQAAANHNTDSSVSKSVPEFIKEKYGIDSLLFVQSNKYYASQIDTYQKMYDEVYSRVKADIAATEAKP